ncbi:MAG: transcriptional repressor [Planctomycetota bacterium]|jgi:Fur family ferric uptake transcriptional regulator|nr:transcriptional repressor [Planctomycetota bacterium]
MNTKKKTNIDDVNEARKMLKDAGLRSTPARISVINALKKSSRPQTHAQLADQLVPLGFDKATVFRNLTDLAEAELVLRTELGDHVWRFEMRDPKHDRSSHPHFVCVDCGSVTCIDEMALPTPTVRRNLNIARISEVLVKGHCGDCDASRAVSR